MATVPVTPVVNQLNQQSADGSGTDFAPLLKQESSLSSAPPVPAKIANAASTPAPAKLTGEARLNAILRLLQEKHGFHFPVALFDPKTDK